MSRILLFCVCFSVCCLFACTKSSQYGIVQYRAQATADDDTIEQYIKTHGLTGIAKHVHNNDTIGVWYIVINPGQASTLYSNSTQVTVGDTGRLITGQLLTNTSIQGQLFQETKVFTPTFPLGQLILGWQLGIPEVGAGGEVRLLMASRYAYGHYAQPELGLPANAKLDFRIGIYDVTN